MADTSPPPHSPNLPEPAAGRAGGTAPLAGPDEVALVIDDRPVVAKKGTTVLQAAEKAGLLIPHYCYHPGLSIAGNCRMCLIEIEKAPKLQIGCATVAVQGMVVRTATERARRAREGIMESLLINHPLVCPVGALTEKEFRFKARVWFLKDVPSVCAGCARGCNVSLATYENRIHRMTPRTNLEVNQYWMCDAGRLSYKPLYESPRLDRPV